MRPIHAALVALLVLMPLAAADSLQGVAARLDADDLAVAGSGTTSGALAAFILSRAPKITDGPLGPAPEAGTFTIRADSLSVEADYEKQTAELGLVAHEDGTRQTFKRPYGGAELRSDVARGAFAMAVLPSAAAQVETGWTRAHVSPSTMESVSVTNWVNQERAIEAVTARALSMRFDDAPTSLAVRGDFRVALWYWNVTVRNEAQPGGALEWSGERSQSLTPGVSTPEGARANVERQFLILDIKGGVLEFAIAPTTEFALLQNDVSLVGAANWTLHGADGLLGDGDALRPAAARELELQGSLGGVATSREDGRIHAEMRGDLDKATLDGVPIDWAATVVAGNESWRPGVWSLAFAGIALAPAAAWTGQRARRRIEQRRIEALELAMGLGDYDTVTRSAPRLARTAFARDAAALHIEALLQLGRIDEARQLAVAQTGWDGPAAPSLDLVRALVAAHAGQKEETVTHLVSALRAAPEFRSEVLARAVFANARSDPRLRPLLRNDARARNSIAYA